MTETWTKLAVADPTGFCSVDKLESGGRYLRVPGTWIMDRYILCEKDRKEDLGQQGDF